MEDPHQLREHQEVLYRFVSRGEDGLLETALLRGAGGRLKLTCRLEGPEGEESVAIEDPGRDVESALSFARAVAESRTHPRIIPELWEEFAP